MKRYHLKRANIVAELVDTSQPIQPRCSLVPKSHTMFQNLKNIAFEKFQSALYTAEQFAEQFDSVTTSILRCTLPSSSQNNLIPSLPPFSVVGYRQTQSSRLQYKKSLVDERSKPERRLERFFTIVNDVNVRHQHVTITITNMERSS